MKRTRYQENQEGLKNDANKKDKKDLNHMMENFEKIEEDMVTSFGKFGRCNAPEAMLCPRRFASRF
jgi:hypothetical protein